VDVALMNLLGGTYEVLAEVSFPVPLTENWRIGFAAASHNNDISFASRSVSSIQYSYYDPPPPTVEIRQAGSAVTLSWIELEGPSWELLSRQNLAGLTSWDRVTNAVVRVPGPFYITNLATMQLDADSHFFSLRRRQ
jgi:hypothetical protein